jgi:isoquinoline 1-oxidoreductase alpha subunit
VLALKGLLLADPAPARDQLVSVLSGHLCRCGSYSRILAAASELVEDAHAHDAGPAMARPEES